MGPLGNEPSTHGARIGKRVDLGFLDECWWGRLGEIYNAVIGVNKILLFKSATKEAATKGAIRDDANSQLSAPTNEQAINEIEYVGVMCVISFVVPQAKALSHYEVLWIKEILHSVDRKILTQCSMWLLLLLIVLTFDTLHPRWYTSYTS